MEVNQFYRELFEYTLGLDVLGLESRFRDLVRLVETKTLLTFGNYFPVRYNMLLDLNDDNLVVPKHHNTRGMEYFLHDDVLDKYNLPILGIDGIDYSNNDPTVDPYDPETSAFLSAMVANRNNITVESVLMGAEYTYNRTLTDFAIPYKRYHELRGSRVLYLENWAHGTQIELRIKTRYPNIVAIPEEYHDIFMTLAKYDVKIKLWNELKYLEDIVTPAGNINLKISDWDSADKDRDDYIRDLKSKTLPDRILDNYFRLV